MGLTQSYIGIPMMRSKVVTTTAHDYTISVHFTRLQMIEASELRVYTLNLFFLFSFFFFFLFFISLFSENSSCFVVGIFETYYK